jgi:hypothetical protein
MYYGVRGTRYHHADLGQKAAARHNWKEERRLLWVWEAEGLQMLLPSTFRVSFGQEGDES